MKYKENIILKNGQDCMIRNVLYEDGLVVIDVLRDQLFVQQLAATEKSSSLPFFSIS